MRRFPDRTAVLAALLLAACSGANEVVNPPPPPPPPPASATSLVIQAGDNQQATLGMPVPTSPAVKAVSSTGAGVGGVLVTFAIASGGGSLEHTTATTGSDGIATAGLWTLGDVVGGYTMTASAPGLPPVTFHATASAPPLQATDTTIGTGGGVVTVRSPGQPGDGFQLTIAAGSYPAATHVVIAVDTERTLQLPSGVTLVGPVYRITGFPAAPAGSFLKVTLPVTRSADIALEAFMRDPVTGRLEMLSPVDRSAGGFSLVSRHLSTDLMFNKPAGSARRAASFRAGTPIEVVLLQAAESTIAGGTDSGFRPGVDDWEFANQGSYVAPGGHCEGQSLSAIWYYIRRKPIDGPLFNRFNEIDTRWEEDRVGYRFASTVQRTIDYAARAAVIRSMRSLASAGSISQDRLFYDAGAVAIQVTGEPQIVSIWDTGNTVGHAIVMFRTDAAHVYVSDPNYPGLVRSIDFDGTTFAPFSAASNATAGSLLFTRFAIVGPSNALELMAIDALWPQVLQGTIGQGVFPDYTMQYFDLLSAQWLPLLDTVTTRQDVLKIRPVCSSCFSGLPDVPASGAPNFVEWLVGTDAQGIGLGSGTVVGVTADGTAIPLVAGSQRVGARIFGTPEVDNWSYLDWRWLTINSVPFGISPNNARINADSTLNLAARPYGSVPAQQRFVWDFDDGTPSVTVFNDSTVQHKFTTGGLRNVSVEMWDQVANRKLARAVGTVEVDDSLTVWTIDSLWGTAPGWNPTDVQTASDYPKHAAFFSQLRATPGNGKIVYLEPPGNPSAATIKITQSPDPSGLNSLILAARTVACQTVDTLIWTGTTIGGSVTGKGRPNVCLIGASQGLQTYPEIPYIDANAVGNTLTGFITIRYTDFDRVGNFHVPKATQTVQYQFRAHR